MKARSLRESKRHMNPRRHCSVIYTPCIYIYTIQKQSGIYAQHAVIHNVRSEYEPLNSPQHDVRARGRGGRRNNWYTCLYGSFFFNNRSQLTHLKPQRWDRRDTSVCPATRSPVKIAIRHDRGNGKKKCATIPLLSFGQRLTRKEVFLI